ncbi:hypothetical protein [Streptomyces pakalii]|uniref:Uncharacterized protein n=1 Tax=Streptomyces pakalii TaxID=3036494 RepID=A0ABT7DHR1_9ACTN|nr:hypothetical protein [Streptomyces pakalii]MDJ1645375.1 hypothetical protein [Streptomyces pakalii]
MTDFESGLPGFTVVPDVSVTATQLRWSAPELVAAANEKVPGVTFWAEDSRLLESSAWRAGPLLRFLLKPGCCLERSGKDREKELKVKVAKKALVGLAMVTTVLGLAGTSAAAAPTAEGGRIVHEQPKAEAGWEYAGKFLTMAQCEARGRDGYARGEWAAWGCSYSPQGDPALPYFLGVLR